ncbi:uncharacterized protein LOC132951038 isoform X1 [Metopolophium dirhodum]|uniref:uncharacterized protein LOC132939492 isoform X1 n=1 Tax=Metopolophium dirhodum TaxID=44670 RepID=UPI00298FC42C|nr:uncharacterized protein LOC132939492 isoform X1 [Metopolophium dirhodum]XP_060878707.1 uncharacterized protein LOC132951038 isoform X1 [Metopolophium dirhodum]
MAGSIEDNAALYKKKTFTYVPPSPPAELIETTSYTINFTARKFILVGVDPTDNFQVTVHLLTPSRHVKISPDFLRRIFSMMGHILSFILDTVQYKRIIFLETEFHKISSMVYGGENVLVIESKTQDGCRVLLNREDLIKLQYLECSIFESIVRKEINTAPLITRQFDDFAMYLHEKSAHLKSPPKNLEEMLIFIKNVQDDRTEKIYPNMIGQIQMYATVQLAETVLQQLTHELQNGQMDTPTSPSYSPVSNIFSIHDDSSARDGFNQPKDDILAKVIYINIVLKIKTQYLFYIYFSQALDHIDGPARTPAEIRNPQACEVNDGPDFFYQFRTISPPQPYPTFTEHPVPSHKRSQSTFAKHPTPVRDVKRRLF